MIAIDSFFALVILAYTARAFFAAGHNASDDIAADDDAAAMSYDI